MRAFTTGSTSQRDSAPRSMRGTQTYDQTIFWKTPAAYASVLHLASAPIWKLNPIFRVKPEIFVLREAKSPLELKEKDNLRELERGDSKSQYTIN